MRPGAAAASSSLRPGFLRKVSLKHQGFIVCQCSIHVLSLAAVHNLGGSSSRPPARAPRANRIWRACARPFPRRSMDMALAFCPPTEPFRAARRRAGPCGGHIAHGQALEGSVARYRSCHSVLIANVGSIRRVCHSNHVLNQTAARPTEYKIQRNLHGYVPRLTAKNVWGAALGAVIAPNPASLWGPSDLYRPGHGAPTHRDR